MAPEREDAKHFDNRVSGIRAKTKITLTSHWSKVAGGGVIPLHKLSIHSEDITSESRLRKGGEGSIAGSTNQKDGGPHRLVNKGGGLCSSSLNRRAGIS
jgi:hypothetical protein